MTTTPSAVSTLDWTRATPLEYARAAEDAIARGEDPGPAWLALLADRVESARDAGLRLRLARAYLRLLGPGGAPRVLEWARSGDAARREAAYDALHELGPGATPLIRELAESGDSEVRWCAYQVAAHLHRMEMVDILVRGLRDEASANRWAAGTGLVALGRRALVPVLRALVAEPATLPFHAAARRVLAQIEVVRHADLRKALLDSLSHGTTTVQSGPLAEELLNRLRHDGATEQVGRRAARPQPLAPAVRRAEARDVEAVQHVWTESGLTPASAAEWDALTGNPASVVLVAEHEGAIVGAAVATFDGWRAYVYHVAVTPPYRGRGVGRLLMERAEEHLVAAGARYGYAAINEQNTEGVAMAVFSGYLPEGDLVFAKELGRVATG